MNDAKRYLIVNAYSAQNMGDAAINLATVALVRAHGAVSVGTAGRYHRHDEQFYAGHGIATVSPAIPFGPPGDGSLPLRALQFAAGTIWAALLLVPFTIGLPALSESLARWTNADGLLELLTADIVVLAGGGYLFSARRRINASLIHSLAVIWLALAARKRLVMMPQSIGPLKGTFDRWIVKKTLAHVSPIVVREQTAFAELTELMDPADLRLCPDVALYGWPERALAPRRSSRRTVGVLVMDWTWARDTSRSGLDRYRQELLTVISDLQRADIDVMLLGGCNLPELGQDDMVVAREIADLATTATGKTPALAEVSDPDAFRSLLATLDLVVGTRLHSCLLALACGVPAIALGYQPKTAGSYELLGLHELYHDVETFTAADVGRQAAAILGDESAWNDRVARAAERARTEIERLYDELL